MHGCGRSRRIGRVQEKTCDRLKVRRIKLSRANASSETQFYTVDICEDYHNTRIQRVSWYCQAAIDRPIVTCSGMLFPVCCLHELPITEVLTEVSVQREGLYWGVTLGAPCTSNDGDWGDIQYGALTALCQFCQFQLRPTSPRSRVYNIPTFTIRKEGDKPPDEIKTTWVLRRYGMCCDRVLDVPRV
jgi:hypothetical protein